MTQSQWRSNRYKENVLRAFQEDGVSSAPGVTRAAVLRGAKEYKLKVVDAGSPPMIVRLRAETAAKAVEYAKNRWPSASIRRAA